MHRYLNDPAVQVDDWIYIVVRAWDGSYDASKDAVYLQSQFAVEVEV